MNRYQEYRTPTDKGRQVVVTRGDTPFTGGGPVPAPHCPPCWDQGQPSRANPWWWDWLSLGKPPSLRLTCWGVGIGGWGRPRPGPWQPQDRPQSPQQCSRTQQQSRPRRSACGTQRRLGPCRRGGWQVGERRRHPHARPPVGRDGRTAGRVGQRGGLARPGGAGASGWAPPRGRVAPANPGMCGSGRTGLWGQKARWSDGVGEGRETQGRWTER